MARRFYYDSLVFDLRAIRYLADLFGPDRLLVGSDYPAMGGSSRSRGERSREQS
jgi:hypothetical protein